jgi:hypothetical protein
MKYTQHGSGHPSASHNSYNAQGNPARPPGIEGVEMRKVYYSLMRIPARSIPWLALPLLYVLAAAQQTPIRTASLEAHEGVTIMAKPWMDASKYKEKFPKKSPYAAGVLAVEVSFRNDSDDSVKVNLARIRLTIHLDSENTQELPSLSSEELAQAVLKPGGKDPTATRKKVPLPVPLPKGGKDKNLDELQRQAQDASVPTGVIGPHSTVQGLLYFDLQSQFDLLDTAHLYVPDLILMRGNRALTYFDIDLGQPGTASNEKSSKFRG